MFALHLDHTITAVVTFLVKQLQEQVSQAKIHVTQEALTIVGMDDSLTCLTRIVIGKQSCDRFEYTHDLTVGVHLKALAAVLACCGPTETVTLQITDDFIVVQTNAATEFEINQLMLDMEDLAIPKVTPCAHVDTVEVTLLMKKILKLEAEDLTLSLLDGAVEVTTRGELVHKASFQLPSPKTLANDVRMTVSPQRLAWLLKFGKIEKNFGLSMGTRTPMGVHASVQHVRVDAFLAPMVSD